MNTRALFSLVAIAVSGASGAAAQGTHSRSTASTMVNGRRIVAHTDKGAASIATSGGAAAISIPGHKIKVEKARITLDNQAKPIAPTAKRVEVDARGGKVNITVDHKVLFNQGR
jgi:hypothetical protein